MARKYINFLQNLPGIPELTLDKLMGDYYDAVFSRMKRNWHKLKRIKTSCP